MTTTPTLWLAEQQANTTDAGTPNDDQTLPRIVGLANGGFVALWESNTDGGPDGSAGGTDIIGQIYDAEGYRIGGEFRANQGFFNDDEGDFDAAALPNGNFVIAYEDTDASGTSIRYTVLSSTGALVSFGTIAADPGAAILGSPSVSVNSDGSFLVAYQQNDGSANPVSTSAAIVSSGGTVGTPFVLLSGGLGNGSVSLDASVSTLTNGNYVIVGRAFDADSGFYMRIVNSTGGNVLGFTEVSGTIGDTESDSEPSVTGLSGGGFVVAWTNTDASDTDVIFQIYSSAGAAIGGQHNVNSGGSTDNNNEPEVIGLSDGGFVIVYDDDETDTIRLQRYSSTGVEIGDEVVVTDSASETSPTITLADDGRLLVGWATSVGSDSDIEFEIYDPREATINGTGSADTITSRLDGATVNGLSGSDTIFGQNAADTLRGGDGGDTIYGRAGIDLIEGGLDGDILYGGDDNDNLYANTQADADGSAVGDYLYGQAGADNLRGSGGDDVLDGGIGNDVMTGGAGNDTYFAELADTIVEVAGGGSDRIIASSSYTLAAGAAIEAIQTSNQTATTVINFVGNSISNRLSGNNGANILNGLGGFDILQGFAGNDTYYVESATGNDQVIEIAGQGTLDRVLSLNTFALAADDDIEYLGTQNEASTTALNLLGNALSQTIVGNAGNNILVGNAGRDVYRGLGGVDTFSFRALSDSGNTAGTRDVVEDFDDIAGGSGDKLDIAMIDAITGGTDQAFTFRAANGSAFTGAGQVRWFTSGGNTFVELNVDGDLAADFSFMLTGIKTLEATDFWL